MTHKIFFLTLICLITNALRAENSQIFSHVLNWKGIEKWQINASTTDVISFEGAKYPTEDRLPYFNKRISYESKLKYTVEVINPVFIDLSLEEKKLVNSNISGISKSINPQVSILESQNVKYLDINVSPFVFSNDNLKKLSSFDLQINVEPKAQRVSSANSIHTYTDNSVLAQGKFVKIRISKSGVYKLTYEDLNAMGVNPANVRVFGYGGAMLEQSFLIPKKDDLPELSIYMNKGSDNVFNAGDYILFYGQGVDSWKYDSSRSFFSHTLNTYSKYGYYFVSSDAGIGKKIESKSEIIPEYISPNKINEFTDYDVYEKELKNLISIDNEAGSGKVFYGETFNNSSIQTFTFNFPNSVLTSNSIKTKLDVAAASTETSNFELSLNGEQTSTLYVSKRNSSDMYEQAKGTYSYINFTPTGDSQALKLKYNKANSTSTGYLNFIEVNARRKLIMSGPAMQFQNVDYFGTNSYNKYLLSAANNTIEIWDITDQTTISKINTELKNDTISFTSSCNELKTYIAINPTSASSFPKPDIIGLIPNQNLHALSPVDMVIITHPDFIEQSNLLAEAHRDIDNLSVEVVTTEQVYNEFSSGAPDATAYRWVMKMLYDRAIDTYNTQDNPKYLLLFGRGSFDNRKVLKSSGDNLVLTYQAENSLVTTLSYTTDDYFGLLDDNEGTQVPSNLVDLGIGRFPVVTKEQATDVVNKTISYMRNQGKGNWKNQLCFLADDGDGALHMRQADSIAVSIARISPAFQINKIYLDAFVQEITASGEAYPLAKSKFQNLLRSGLMVLNYTGHAGAQGLTNEGMLSTADVNTLSNKNLPIFIGATCDFLQYDVKLVSAGEHVILNPQGGGIGILSAARPVYASQNFVLNKLFLENLFKKENGEYVRIGDALRKAKRDTGTEINKLSYIYMGDPAVKLNYPTKYQVKTTKINENVTLANDTLRSLSVASIEGLIADDNGNKIENFNGSVQVVVYDKKQKITTLNNHNDGTMSYYDRPNTLFSGEADVKNGSFTITFMLPRDIKYNYGAGRVNYYAKDEDNNFEAQGYFENFTVGGTNKNAQYETDGPEMQIYLNSNSFISGDKVNETPLFIANLSDINGINTVGSGIGHDITITVDEDPTQFYVLNEYYRAKENSYSEGTVSYKFSELKDGKHTLTFRAWDLLNNSTSKTIEFEVVKGLQPTIFKVSNYPNPVKTNTTIIVDHDRPESILYTTVEIFDLSGRKIWTFNQASADNITWDLTGADGNKVKTGIYLYRVNIKTSNSEYYSKSNKMFIVEQ